MNLEPLSVSLKLTSDQFRAGIAGAQQSLAGLKSNLSGAQQSVKNFGKGLTDIGKNLTTKVTLPIVGFGVFAVKAASDLNEAWSAASTVYGKGADVIIGKSKEAATQVGLSQEQYLSSAATLGVFANSAGLAGKDAAGFSAELITGAGDLASFYNAAGGVPQVLDDIKSGLAGETEPLRKYGILLSQATLEQYAQEQGIWDGVDAMTEQEKVLARQGFILSHLGAAQGDFARTSGGLANKTRILKAQFTDLSAQFGAVLLPIVTDLATKFGELLERFQTLTPHQQKMILIVAGIAAAMGPLLIVVGQLAIGLSALIPVFGLLLGPIGLIIAALVLLGIAYKTNFLGFGDAVRSVAKYLKRVSKSFMSLYRVFRKMEAPKVLSAFMALGQVLSDITGLGLLPFFTRMGIAVNRFIAPFGKFVDGFKKLFAGDFKGGLKQMASAIGDFFSAPAKLIGDFLKSIKTGFEPLDKLFQDLGKTWTDFGRLIQEIMQGDWAGALEVGKRLIGHFADYILDVLNLLWIGIKAFFTKIDWGAMLRTGIDKLGDLGAWLLPKGIALIRGLWQGSRDFFTGTVWPWLQDLPGEILAAIPVVADLLYEKGKSLMRGLRHGVQDLWDNTLKPWLKSIGAKAVGAMPSLGEMTDFLKNHGKSLISGFHNGIKAIWNNFGGGGGSTIAGWLLDIGKKAVAAMPTLAEMTEFIKEHGKKLISGFKNGMTGLWTAVDGPADWLSKRGETIRDLIDASIGRIWDAVYNIGYRIINGLASGMYAAAGLILDAIEYLVGLIPPKLRELMGLASPSKVMAKLAYGIPEGMALGIRNGMSLVSAASGELANASMSLGSGSYSAMSGAGTGSSTATTNVGGVTIHVNGSSDPKATAEETFRIFSRELGLKAGL